MVFIDSEGKFNNNSYLIDAQLYRLKNTLSLYIIENEGLRLMIDVGEKLMIRKVVQKIKNLGLYPIHKLLLTHSHFDHVQGVGKLINSMKDTNIEIMASEKAIYTLANPDQMNEEWGYIVDPIENVIGLKEGDIIDLNGLRLEILDFFGHSQDSIAVLDRKNKNIFVGDAIMDKNDQNTIFPEFVSGFNETDYLKTLEKLAKYKKDLNSISLSHFGVWKDDDFHKILETVKDFHFDAKNSIIKWYNENSSLDYIALMYHNKFIPDSELHKNIFGVKVIIEWLVDGLKKIGEIN